MTYKRTKSDSPLFCPYCLKQFSMTMDRSLNYYKLPPFTPHPTQCRSCGELFYYRNITAKYARETGMKSVFTRKEYEQWENTRLHP